MNKPDDLSSLRIFAVIVLYKVAPCDSASFQTLQAAIENCGGKVAIQIFFYDNTPGGQSPGNLPEGTRWESHGKNHGLAVAYNRAIEIAQDEGYDWLLTLDQDTSLPIDFLSKLAATADFVAPLTHVAAIVPRIYDKNKLISPNGLLFDIYPIFLPDDFTGISLQGSTSAINSASTVRISALQRIGGYDPRFPLDYCDAVMYKRLRAAHLRIFVAGHIRVEHKLSVLDMKRSVSPERYEGILQAESAFWDECMGPVAHVALITRYLYRSIYKLWHTGGSWFYAKMNLRFLAKRIFHSRSRRMRDWSRHVMTQFGSSE